MFDYRFVIKWVVVLLDLVAIPVTMVALMQEKSPTAVAGLLAAITSVLLVLVLEQQEKH